MTGVTAHANGTAGALRVILVGRTGFDSRLRLEPGVELVRVPTTLEAVAELAEHAGGPSVVIIAPAAAPEDGADFMAAVRRLDPSARVLRVGPGSPGEDWYDGNVPVGGSPDDVRDAIRGGAAAHEPADDVHALVDSMLGSGPEPGGDASLARRLLHGQDIAAEALEIIRRRLGSAGVSFAAGAEDGPGAPVAWRGRVLGRLVGAGVDDAALAAQASWLGAWLALRDQHAHLRQAAFTDPLTGAHNRRYFDHFLSVALGRAREQRRSVTVLAFDIDDFKTYNDRYGHPAGDEILRQAVRLLQSVIRPSDKVCRIGGDEFAVIFHEPEGPRTATSRPPTSIFEIAQRFQREICSHRFPKLGADAPGTLTISGGLATFPWDGATPEELLARADELALRSKREGKNAITLGPGADRVCRLVDPPGP